MYEHNVCCREFSMLAMYILVVNTEQVFFLLAQVFQSFFNVFPDFDLWFLIPQIFQFFFQVFFLSQSLVPYPADIPVFLSSFFSNLHLWFLIPQIFQFFFQVFSDLLLWFLSRRYSSFSSTFFSDLNLWFLIPQIFQFFFHVFLISIFGSLPRLVLAFFDSAILLFSDSSQTFSSSFSSVPAALFLYL